LWYHKSQIKCFYPNSIDINIGIRVDSHNDLVEINKRCRLCNNNDVFFFVFQTMSTGVLYIHFFIGSLYRWLIICYENQT